MTNKSAWLWFLMVYCYIAMNGCGQEEPKEVQVDQEIQAAELVQEWPKGYCQIHETRLGMATHKSYAGAPTVDHNNFNTDMSEDKIYVSDGADWSPKLGEKWYWGCSSCREKKLRISRQVTTDDPLPSSHAPFHEFSFFPCRVHNRSLTSVPEWKISPGINHPIHMAAKWDFPNAGSAGISELELSVDGAIAKWFPSCPECESACNRWNKAASGPD